MKCLPVYSVSFSIELWICFNFSRLRAFDFVQQVTNNIDLFLIMNENHTNDMLDPDFEDFDLDDTDEDNWENDDENSEIF